MKGAVAGNMKRELLTLIQYIGLLLIALVTAFVLLAMQSHGSDAVGEEYAVAVNFNEMWRNEASIFSAIFLSFLALGVARLLIIFLASLFVRKSYE